MNCCDLCGALVENCRCPACWACGAIDPACNDTHRFRTYRAAVAAVLEQSGGNYLAAAAGLGIHNSHLYKIPKHGPSPTLKKALREKGYMYVKKKRFRLAADFEDEAERQRFIDRNLNGSSFTEWVGEKGE